ncbi:MAG: hypothetical protein KatS3mg052_0559 [Candidatus Roseilinea sp.]|nr:MAG: hypothetical protein KatS3mg052_0559 [Candidatus Roseilinea sp.]
MLKGPSQAESRDRRENSLLQSAVPLAYRAVRNGVWVALGSYWVIGFGFIAAQLKTSHNAKR